jgi:uncharacterized hydrophobic protein (TIGR00271 family)
MAEVARELRALPGARHVVRGENADPGQTVVTADVSADASDEALRALSRLAIPHEDIQLLRLESIGPSNAARPFARVVWADLLSQAGTNARPFGRFLVVMAMAGVVAGCGVIEGSAILIVGAMAISPDTLPITATCTGLILRRWRLAARAFATLGVGLGMAGVAAGVMTWTLDALHALPNDFDVNSPVLKGLETVNISTPLVALAAGVVGILALQTRASASVGVGISVTTIPAATYLAVATAVGAGSKASGALLVLGVNVAMLIVSGTATLALQRRLGRGRPATEAAMAGEGQRPPTESCAHGGQALIALEQLRPLPEKGAPDDDC